MSYATPEDVKALFRSFAITSEAAVTDEKIQAWLDNAFSNINSKIGRLYQMPIDETASPESWNILKEIESFKVAGIVDDVLNSYSEADKKPLWEKRAMNILNELAPQLDRDGRQPIPIMILPDAVYLGTSTQKARPRLQPNTTPTFIKGANNW